MSLYSVLHALFAGFVRGIHRVKVEGIENIEEGGHYLICSNHIAFDDPIILGAVLPIQPKYMAKKELIAVPLVGSFLRTLGAYPIDRKGNDAAAIRKSISLLKNGESIIMFPQGTRSGGRLPSGTEPKPGCAMIASRAGCDVLPILIETKDYRQSFLRRTVVRIGKPIPACEVKEAADVGYDEGARLIFGRICSMETPSLVSSPEVKKLGK